MSLTQSLVCDCAFCGTVVEKGERKMKGECIVVCMAFIAILCLGYLGPSEVYAQSGPRTAHMKIHIYLHPDLENADLEAGILDINDWPLAKAWIDEWALMPGTVTLRDYVELGMRQIDINNQMWPTGCPDHKYYNETCEKCQKALKFRQAIACLTDRDRIVAEVLGGYGYRLDVPVPPSQSAYMDMPLYRSLGLIYDYNVTRAIEFLNAGGFIDTDYDGIRNDPYTGANMAPLKFYIRMDDSLRMRAGQMLAAELEAVGVPVDAIITEKTLCYNQVMVLYDYHLYTGYWDLSMIPDQYYDLYSSYTYYAPYIGWSLNYPGFCNHEFDSWAEQVRYPATVEDAQTAAKKCGELFLKYCAIVPMWSSIAVKAYKTGWTGVVNNGLFGVDNTYTFLNIEWEGAGTDDTIDWGFKCDIEQLNVISSEWLWDRNVLGLIYDTMIRENPFNGAPTEFFLASDYVGTTWDATAYGGDPDATQMVWTVRSGVLWHDGSALTRDDIKFSIDFNIAWGIANWNVMMEYPWFEFDTHDVTLGPNATQVTVRMLHKNAWSFQWFGGLPIIKQGIWENIKDSAGRTWTDPYFDFTAVRQYDPATEDVDESGTVDLKEDGTGPWVFNTYMLGEYVTLDANANYYFTQTQIENSLKTMFHYYAGDINEDGVVNVVDIGWIAYAFGTTGDPSEPPKTPPIPYNTYNSAADLNKDGNVDAIDLNVVGRNYGSVMG